MGGAKDGAIDGAAPDDLGVDLSIATDAADAALVGDLLVVSQSDLGDDLLANSASDLLPSGYGGPPFEAFFYALAKHRNRDTVPTIDEEGDGMFWQPGSNNMSTADAYFPGIAALASVAVGDCGTEPGIPAYSATNMSAGSKVYYKDGATTLLALSGGPPSTQNYYGGATNSGGQLLGKPLDFVTAGGTIPVFTVADLGTMPGLTVPTDVNCAAGSSCTFSTTLEGTVEDYYFTTIGLRVCRANASTGQVTLPKSLVDAIGASAPSIVTLVALHKVQVMVGTSPILFYLMTSKVVLITVT